MDTIHVYLLFKGFLNSGQLLIVDFFLFPMVVHYTKNSLYLELKSVYANEPYNNNNLCTAIHLLYKMYEIDNSN